MMMTWRQAWVLSVILGAGVDANAGEDQVAALSGRVALDFVGQSPARSVTVTTGGASSTRTDDQGAFRLVLPTSSRAGDRIKLAIDLSGWCILSPFNGEVVVPPAAGEPRPIQVRLLRAEGKPGPPQDCLTQVLEGIANKPNNAAREDQKYLPLDLPGAIKEWAARQGSALTDAEAREELRQWLAAVQATPHPEPQALGLLSLAEKRFSEAHVLFMQAAEAAEKLPGRSSEQGVRSYRLAGEAARQEANFDAALLAYQKALDRVARAAQPELWASVMNDLGMIHRQLGVRTIPGHVREQLESAISAYRLALQVYTQKELPRDWAMTQHNLGTALDALGVRLGGAEGERRLDEAEQAYRLALQVHTQKELPQQWAMTQTSLAIALGDQALHAGVLKGQQRLDEAEKLYRLALQVYTRKELPQQWAMVQASLGIVLANQGLLVDGVASQQRLTAAEEAYRLALQVYHRKHQPQQWAAVQKNLGSVLADQGLRAKGSERQRLLETAVVFYRAALQVHTQKELPQDWASTQNSLGNALSDQAQWTVGAEKRQLLEAAEKAYRSALQVFTEKELPQDWAMTQNNLGATLEVQGENAAGAKSQQRLTEALTAYRLALQVRTQEARPRAWAATQNNVGVALQELGKRTAGARGPQLFGEAVKAHQLAMQVWTREERPHEWAWTQKRLSEALKEQGLRSGGAERRRILGEAAAAYLLLLEFTPDHEGRFAIVFNLFTLYQEQLFEFDRAYDLLKKEVEHDPNDKYYQAQLAQATLTTGHFAEAAEQLATLVEASELSAQSIALQTLRLVALTASGDTEDLPARLKALRDLLDNQPSDESEAEESYHFAGVKEFLAHDVRVARRRAWLLALVAAMELRDQNRLRAVDAVMRR